MMPGPMQLCLGQLEELVKVELEDAQCSRRASAGVRLSQSLAAFRKVLGIFGSIKHSNNYVLI